MPKLLEDATVEAIRIRSKWENNDDICRGHILNGMSDSLFDVYMNVESAKELWDSLESKYMTEDSSSKKILVSNFNNYKMVDSRPIMEQNNELLRILGQYTQHGLKMEESISVSSINDKFHLRIEESLTAQDSDKGKGKEVSGPSVNMIEEGGKNNHHKENKGKKWSNKNNNGSSSNKKLKLECWKCGKTGHFKRDCHSCKKNNANADGSEKGSKDQSQDQEDGSILYMGDDHFAPVHGKGSVALEFSSRKTITLFNVLCVPKLRKNLVSGPMLNKCGYKQVYESDKYILSKSCVFVGFGYYNNGQMQQGMPSKGRSGGVDWAGRIMIWRGFGDQTFAGYNGLLRKEDEKSGVKDGAYLYYGKETFQIFNHLDFCLLDTGKKFLPSIRTRILRHKEARVWILHFDHSASLVAVRTENYCINFYSLFDDHDISKVLVCERNHQPSDDVTGTMVNADLHSDIAFVKINSKTPLPTAKTQVFKYVTSWISGQPPQAPDCTPPAMDHVSSNRSNT
uniref:Zinc finger, CCHC-type n=1 Tax=Tanacetum cinerariifolium TaxID=118510 RepID=A0A6L2J3Z2_TANCI|nr:zinc finger, CCHC-type [Tanacetum cinerariifolium]